LASLLADVHFLLKTRAFDECPCADCRRQDAWEWSTESRV